MAPQAQPPVCRLMDYGRFRFDERKREGESRRRQASTRLKQMNFRPKALCSTSKRRPCSGHSS
ncbi:MAG: hypothetical protein ACYDGR_08210 [Candidatus Dormibacteria bacterium]